MSIRPVTGGNPVAQPSPNDHTLTATEQKTSNVGMQIVLFGLSICKRNPDSREPSACYAHIGVGNLLVQGNNVFIGTVAHLFTEKDEEYFLVEGDNPLIPFRFAVTREQKESVHFFCIPIGQMDTGTREIVFKTNSTFHGAAHFHV